jgi:hypothetical protein
MAHGLKASQLLPLMILDFLRLANERRLVINKGSVSLAKGWPCEARVSSSILDHEKPHP